MLRYFYRLIRRLRAPGPEVGRRKPWLSGLHRCRRRLALGERCKYDRRS